MRTSILPCLAAALLLSACGSGSSSNSASGPRLLSSSNITGVGTGTNFGFDIGIVSGNRYYVTDRNNAAVDVFDTGTNQQVGQIKGTGANAFAGSRTTNGSVDNSISGPNGINMVGN